MATPHKPMLLVAASLMAVLTTEVTAFAETLNIPVPTSVIYPGDQIIAAKLLDKEFFVPGNAAASYVLLRPQIEGKYAKRTLLPGKPIPLAYLKLKESVVQGVLTRATFQQNGLEISTYLIPLQSGTAGELIDARNAEYGRVIKALVKEDGTLQVGGL